MSPHQIILYEEKHKSSEIILNGRIVFLSICLIFKYIYLFPYLNTTLTIREMYSMAITPLPFKVSNHVRFVIFLQHVHSLGCVSQILPFSGPGDPLHVNGQKKSSGRRAVNSGYSASTATVGSDASMNSTELVTSNFCGRSSVPG